MPFSVTMYQKWRSRSALPGGSWHLELHESAGIGAGDVVNALVESETEKVDEDAALSWIQASLYSCVLCRRQNGPWQVEMTRFHKSLVFVYRPCAPGKKKTLCASRERFGGLLPTLHVETSRRISVSTAMFDVRVIAVCTRRHIRLRGVIKDGATRLLCKGIQVSWPGTWSPWARYAF